MKPSDAMLDHMKSMEVWPDYERQQAMSCLVHGFVHDREDVKLLSMVLIGVGVMEVFSPARAVKLCDKYGLTLTLVATEFLSIGLFAYRCPV